MRTRRVVQGLEPLLEHRQRRNRVLAHVVGNGSKRRAIERLGREPVARSVRERQVQLRRPPAERCRARQIPVLKRSEERRRRLPVLRLLPLPRFQPFPPVRRIRSLDPRRYAFVVPPQFVDRELPSRSLMLDRRLDDGERARFHARTQVLERAGERRRPREPLFRQHTADLELWIRRRLDAAEQFQHESVVRERNAVALFGASARPSTGRLRLRRGGR